MEMEISIYIESVVWQSCVELFVTSSSPRSKCRIAELPFLVSLSPQGSQLRIRGLFHCKVPCLSLTV